MKIIAKTLTHLNLRVNLTKDVLLDWMGWLFYGVLATSFLFSPHRMELQCQRTRTDIACQVKTWSIFYLHSQTKSIQLQSAQVENRSNHKGTRLILKTVQGEIVFLREFDSVFIDPSNSNIISDQKTISDFLNDSNQSNLNVAANEITPVILSLIVSICYLIFSGFKIPQLLTSPVGIRWNFVRDPNLRDFAENDGIFSGEMRGLIGKQEFCYPFRDIVSLDGDIVISKRRGSATYRVFLRLRSIGKIELSPKGLSAAEWKEVTSAIGEILQIAPPELPQRNLWQQLLWGKKDED